MGVTCQSGAVATEPLDLCQEFQIDLRMNCYQEEDDPQAEPLSRSGRRHLLEHRVDSVLRQRLDFLDREDLEAETPAPQSVD